jgi:hypothetical protein
LIDKPAAWKAGVPLLIVAQAKAKAMAGKAAFWKKSFSQIFMT